MWGINAAATVLGAVTAMIIAMVSGFTTVLMLSAAGYLVAILCHQKNP